ncbi:hypothetical protein NDU88_007004 [Pleurodeles waltl]|uniref:Uncharacterized protein n=1 Tax=Pleurodeles waltl TaxID=8319 RepID=A0AAV7QKQ1_PLEWA|nr:hypothetical protein NDU88_007004 [Pleurodeles waltl]
MSRNRTSIWLRIVSREKAVGRGKRSEAMISGREMVELVLLKKEHLKRKKVMWEMNEDIALLVPRGQRDTQNNLKLYRVRSGETPKVITLAAWPEEAESRSDNLFDMEVQKLCEQLEY